MASTTSAWKIGFFGKGYGRTARTGQESLDAGREGRADSQESSISEDFAKRMVPFYAQCLIEVEFPALELVHLCPSHFSVIELCRRKAEHSAAPAGVFSVGTERLR